MQCHCGLAGGFRGGASSLLCRGSISQYGHAGDWATRLVYIFSGLVFFGGALLPWEDASADCSMPSCTHHSDVRLPRAPAALRFLPTSHFPQGGDARYLAREASPGDGDASRRPDLTSPPPPSLLLLSLAIYGSHFLPSRS